MHAASSGASGKANSEHRRPRLRVVNAVTATLSCSGQRHYLAARF
jgi:hypothetical protein